MNWEPNCTSIARQNEQFTKTPCAKDELLALIARFGNSEIMTPQLFGIALRTYYLE
jgi:hypothetical protein